MAVTSLTIISPVDDFTPRSLRPATSVVWVGGTGPFDVLYEWDTATTFDSGNLISDLNQGVTSPDEGVPPSDMGAFGTDWYLRVTIYDLADTGTDEIQSVYNDATGGTFTLDFDLGGPTGDLDYNAPNVSVAAEGTLTLDTQPSNGDTFTVDTKTYTFQTTLTNVDGNIAIGADLAGSQSNLVEAFDLSGTAGTDYATAMTAHPTVDIAAFATNAAVLTAKTAGKGGNSLATTETFTAGTNVFDATTLGTTTLGNNGIVTELEALSTITSVTVSGSGTSGDPWLVTFTDPGNRDVSMMTADDTNLTGHTVGTTISESTKGVYPTGTVAPGTGYYTLLFVDPTDHPRFLGLQHNVGINFGAGGAASDHPDGDPVEFPRFLYANHNVGVGFGSDVDGVLGDGEPDTFDRFLYLNHNITSDQPCPYVQKIAPTLSLQGGAITIDGDSFGATASTYQSEVRIYEDQDHSGAYVAMSISSWSDTEISATVPGSATTGWVIVVHTNGSQTCFGSTPKLLTIEQVQADPDAGWWLKTANRLNVPTAEHTVQPGNNVKTSFRKIMNAIGSGQVEIPLGDPIINDFVDPVTRKGVLVQVYLDNRMRYGWYAESMSHDYNEEGDDVVIISGRGMEVVALWNKLLPYDYPASPTKNPTWIYGSVVNLIENPGFEDAVDNPILANAGGEDGNDVNGNAEGWTARGDNLDSYKGVFDSNDARTGDWYIEVDASDNHSGITQSISVQPNKEYHVQAYVKDPLASGMRVTLALGGADDIAAKATYPNNFEWGNEILAELDNVPRNVAGNGLPGGSTDGTWQVMDVEVLTGKEQTSLSITIQNDHHSTGVFNPFWVDDVSIVGYGLGLDPWRGRNPEDQSSSSFQLWPTTVFEGTYACSVNAIRSTAGIEQTVAVNPRAKYTLTAWLYAPSGQITSPVPTATGNNYGSSYPPPNTIDGDTGTAMRSQSFRSSATIYVQYDFGEQVLMGGIKLLQSQSPILNGYDAVNVQVFGSNNASDWDSLGTFVLTDGWNELAFAQSNYRYWRVQENDTTGSYWYIYEVTFWTSLTEGVWNLDLIEPDGVGVLAQDSHVPDNYDWDQYQVVYQMPDNIDEVIVRFTYQGVGDPGTVIMDSFSLVVGEPAATAGKILNDVLDAMNGDGKLTYLSRTWTDSLDSAGQLWQAPLALDIEPTESLYGLLNRLVALGHEWEIVPAGYLEGGNTGFELNVFTARPFNPESGVGLNHTVDPEGPVIMPGDATVGGRMLKSAFNVNTVMAIGDDGVWSRVTQAPWLDAEMDPSDPAAHGYRDSFGSIEDVISVSASDSTTIAQFAEARLAEEKDRERAIQLQMQRSSVIRPFIDINVGDSLFVDMPPTDADPPVSDGGGGFSRSYPKRIRSIQADLAGEGAEMTFQIDVNKVVYEEQLAWNAMIAQLAERSPGENTGQGTGSVSGAGGVVSVIGGGTVEAGPHTHSLKSTEIKDKALSGDVSGSVPGPVTVNALKGRPVSGTIPAVDGSLEVLMVYDRDTLTWTPVNADVSVGQAYTDSEVFSEPGEIATGTGTGRLYTQVDREIIDVQFSLGVASTSGVVTYDMNMDGTTIFTTQANRPEAAVSAFLSSVGVPDITAWDAGSYLTVDCDAAGTGAETAVLTVRYKEA